MEIPSTLPLAVDASRLNRLVEKFTRLREEGKRALPGYSHKYYNLKILCSDGTGGKYHKESIASYCESTSRMK
jgi:hypothetical protein